MGKVWCGKERRSPRRSIRKGNATVGVRTSLQICGLQTARSKAKIFLAALVCLAKINFEDSDWSNDKSK